MVQGLVVAGSEGFRLGLVALAFGFGVRHGIDWDHIAAITDITSSQELPRRSMLLATLYALGHGLVVLVLGLLAIVFAVQLPRSVDVTMERVVGATLVLLSVYVFYSLARQGREFRMRSRWMLVFAAARRVRGSVRGDDTIVIAHDHVHPADEPHPMPTGAELQHVVVSRVPTPTAAGAHTHHHHHSARVPDDPFLSYGLRSAFGIGMIHGVGAETPTQVLLFLTAAGAGGEIVGVGLLACFILGLLTSNTAVALLSTYGFLRSSSNRGVYIGVSAVIGATSLMLGTLFLVGHGDVIPSILGT
jgi:high-affinity nickel-transport protein